LLLIQLFFANLAAFRRRSLSHVISQQVRHDVAVPMGYGQIQCGGTGVRLILEANVLGCFKDLKSSVRQKVAFNKRNGFKIQTQGEGDCKKSGN